MMICDVYSIVFWRWISMTLLPGTLGHGQLTVPLVRGDSQGRRESYEQRAPVYTMGGNRGGYSATSHLAPEDSGSDFWRGTVCVCLDAFLFFLMVGGGFCWYWLLCLVPVFCMVVRGVKQSPAIVVWDGCKLEDVLQGGHDKMCSIVHEWNLQH